MQKLSKGKKLRINCLCKCTYKIVLDPQLIMHCGITYVQNTWILGMKIIRVLIEGIWGSIVLWRNNRCRVWYVLQKAIFIKLYSE